MLMNTYLITPLALIASASGGQHGAGTVGATTPPDEMGASVERAIDFVRGGINVFDYLSPAQRRAVRECDLEYDVTPGINAAVAAAVGAGPGRVVLPGGCYRTSDTITMPSNVELVGASMRATRIMPIGDFPAITASGTYAHGLTGVGVQNMSIVCAGMGNANAMGVKLVYVNRGKLKDLYFNGCRHALDLYDQWQTSIDNVTADGLGAQQNQVGVYMGPPTDLANKAPNNAVILSNSTMQNVALYGYDLIFFAGSKFINAEAMNGRIGWNLCGEAYIISNLSCQFGHFYNILSDTTDGPGIVVDQGKNLNPVKNIMFDNVWIGSSYLNALHLAGLMFSQFDNIHITRADNGVYLHNSSKVKISVNVAQYNRGNDGSHAAIISGGSNNTLWASNSSSEHPTGYNGISEVGPTYANLIWGGTADCTPELSFGDEGGKKGPAYVSRSCRYEVQGRQVRMTFHLKLSSLGSSSGMALLKNLPFAADKGAPQEGAIGALLADSMVGLNGPIVAQVVPGTSAMRLFSQAETRATPITRGNFSISSSLSGSLEYTRR